MWKKVRPHLVKFRTALWLLSIMLAAWFLFFGHKYKFIYNEGNSMLPTYSDGEWMVMERVPKDFTPNRYDIVLVPHEGELLTKRVIGLPGDSIEIKEGEIFLNDRKLDDPYGDRDLISYILVDENDEELYYWGTSEIVIRLVDENKIELDRGQIWVIGDNRDLSHYGIFLTRDIKGLIVL